MKILPGWMAELIGMQEKRRCTLSSKSVFSTGSFEQAYFDEDTRLLINLPVLPPVCLRAISAL